MSAVSHDRTRVPAGAERTTAMATTRCPAPVFEDERSMGGALVLQRYGLMTESSPKRLPDEAAREGESNRAGAIQPVGAPGRLDGHEPERLHGPSGA